MIGDKNCSKYRSSVKNARSGRTHRSDCQLSGLRLYSAQVRTVFFLARATFLLAFGVPRASMAASKAGTANTLSADGTFLPSLATSCGSNDAIDT